jgi:hypothetical protein
MHQTRVSSLQKAGLLEIREILFIRHGAINEISKVAHCRELHLLLHTFRERVTDLPFAVQNFGKDAGIFSVDGEMVKV